MPYLWQIKGANVGLHGTQRVMFNGTFGSQNKWEHAQGYIRQCYIDTQFSVNTKTSCPAGCKSSPDSTYPDLQSQQASGRQGVASVQSTE